MEIIQGKIPGKNRFTEQILDARKNRVEMMNQQFNDYTSMIACNS